MERWVQILLPMLLVVSIAIRCSKDNGDLGRFSTRDYLSEEKFKSLNVQLHYMPEHQPSNASLSSLQGFLNARLNKPKGIQISKAVIPSSGKSIYTTDDIRNIERVHRTAQASGEEMATYILFVDGYFAGNSNILGVAIGHSTIAIFQKRVQEISGGLLQPSRATLETTILLHEFGHLLGLVNRGTPMVNPHEDAERRRHCNNPDCLMYFAVETADVIANLIDNNIPPLDENCLLDLRNHGGK